VDMKVNIGVTPISGEFSSLGYGVFHVTSIQ
jgi:hypothetical protein